MDRADWQRDRLDLPPNRRLRLQDGLVTCLAVIGALTIATVLLLLIGWFALVPNGPRELERVTSPEGYEVVVRQCGWPFDDEFVIDIHGSADAYGDTLMRRVELTERPHLLGWGKRRALRYQTSNGEKEVRW